MHVCIRIRVHGLPRYGISSVPPPRLGRADPSNMARLRQTLATGLQTAHSTGHTAAAHAEDYLLTEEQLEPRRSLCMFKVLKY